MDLPTILPIKAAPHRNCFRLKGEAPRVLERPDDQEDESEQVDIDRDEDNPNNIGHEEWRLD
ncbi:hypothetical protein BJ508DRAFT_418822 [Ascobolus immersus RN42]|uniref:Uncharacterized protein n=1 Tax=Ascobolus immersus RN42 TaxID=1160509 RepID=A0A3N4HJC0_ASCIM|nr:hypothetical protein BJ508DRAFT_418822 [Ascobolus immersus RN42]